MWMAFVVGGCGGEETPSNHGNDPSAWRVEQQARVVIGSSDAPAHQLDRVYGGLVRSDGSILIGNSGTAELRLFDGQGRHLRTAGRAGGGPGEFRSVNWMQRYRGDSILVFDMRARRFSVWTSAGVFGRTFRVSEGPGSPRPVGVFSDGSVLVAMENQYDPRRPAGIVRDEFDLVRVSPDGARAAKIRRFAGAEWLIYDHTDSFRSTQLPLGRQGHVALSGDHIVYGSADSTKLAVYDTAGRLVRTVDLPVDARKLTPREVRSELEGIEDGAERAALKRYFDANSASRKAPAFSDLRADRSGNLWVRTTNPASPGVAHWHVLNLAGGAVRSVALPSDALLLDIPSPGAVLVREVDADGVHRVALREIVR
jgi:hypothetical protein